MGQVEEQTTAGGQVEDGRVEEGHKTLHEEEREALLARSQVPRFLKRESKNRRLFLITGVFFTVFGVLALLQWIFQPVKLDALHIPAFLPFQRTYQPCSYVGWKDIQRLHNFTTISVHAFANGKPVDAQTVLKPETAVCLLMTVPQIPIQRYRDVPIPGKGPDNLHVILNSSSVTITFEPPRPHGSQIGLDKQFSPTTIIYFAETTLFDAGKYEIHVDQEWSNWEWGHQWWNDVERNVTVYPSGLETEFPNDGNHESRIQQMRRRKPAKHVFVKEADKYPPVLTVTTSSPLQASSNPILSRPFCSPNNTANKGRWYHQNAFAAHIPWDTFDEWGYAWVGDTCRLDYYDEADLYTCLKNRNLHTYGDSNLRRLLLVLMTAGGFCRDVTSVCQGNDQQVEQMNVVAADFNDDNSALIPYIGDNPWGRRLDRGGSATVFGRNSTAMQSFTETMAMNWEDWIRRFYDPKDIKVIIDDEVAEQNHDELIRFNGPAFDRETVLRTGAKARAPPEAGVDADLVILSFGAWDEAFTPTFDDYAKTLPAFRDALMEAYPPPTQFLLKITNGISCMRSFDSYRRYSGTRIQHMQDILKEVFRVGMDGNGPNHGLDGRLMVLDPMSMNGRCDAVRDFGEEHSNHQRFSQIRTEAQMFLNTVCERDPKSKKARWRLGP